MSLVNSGRDFLLGAAMGDEDTLFEEANTYIGVGDGDTDVSASQTDLQGNNTERIPMESGYPKRDPENEGEKNKYRFNIIADEGVADFSWLEWGIFNDKTSGVMLNRVVQDQGTKSGEAIWELEVDVEIVVGS